MATTTDSVDLVGEEVVWNLLRASLFAALMGAFAFVSFPNPLNPAIPVTLQVLGVFLAGIYLGPAWAGFSMLLYLLAGVLGAPVFSGASAGLGVLFGPTGGYLLSYPFAAAVVGAVVHGLSGLDRPATVPVARLVGAMVAGTLVIYTFGILQYWQVSEATLTGAVVGAALVFVPVEAIKIAAAVGIVRDDAVRAN
jgi:biotin transport system substrate-specific component